MNINLIPVAQSVDSNTITIDPQGVRSFNPVEETYSLLVLQHLPNNSSSESRTRSLEGDRVVPLATDVFVLQVADEVLANNDREVQDIPLCKVALVAAAIFVYATMIFRIVISL